MGFGYYLILLPIFLKLAPSLQTAIPLSKHSSVTFQNNKTTESIYYEQCIEGKKRKATFTSRLKPSSTSPQKKVLDVSPW